MNRWRKQLSMLSVFLLYILSVLSSREAHSDSRKDKALKREFFWGVASSAFQNEGSSAPSDWLQWSLQPSHIADGSTVDRRSDFWNRYEEDFDLASSLGVNALRLSIAWERIEPEPGKFSEEAIVHYQKMIQALRARNIEPIVTLHHYVLPLWVVRDGGVQSKNFDDNFARYARFVVGRLAPEPFGVRYWLTLNEPTVLATAGYAAGTWPPGIKDDLVQTFLAIARLSRAHVKAVIEMRKISPDLQIGAAMHWRRFDPLKNSMSDKVGASFCNWAFNKFFLDSVRSGESHLLEKVSLPKNYKAFDFIGINYYGRTMVHTLAKAPYLGISVGPGSKTEIGWEIFPEGFNSVLKSAARYGAPLMITENGVSDQYHDDKVRQAFLKSHVAEMMKARDEGIDILGYLHWTLTDNYEWDLGYGPKFGLVEIDGKTFERKPRVSFSEYRKIIQSYRDKNSTAGGPPQKVSPGSESRGSLPTEK